jgi:DNA-directed RNA polymerase specialized sigma24 family protein
VDSWEQALADLAGGRGAALKRHAFLLCGNDAQADDLVQEALVRAFIRPRRVPGPGAAEAYVRVIMVNLFIDAARRHARWSRVAPLLRPASITPETWRRPQPGGGIHHGPALQCGDVTGQKLL